MRNFFYLFALLLLPATLAAQSSRFEYPVAAQARTTSFTPSVARYHTPTTNGLDTLYQDLNTWSNGLLTTTTREQYNAGTWTSQSRHFYTYDTGDREVMDSVEFWNGSAWVPNGLVTYAYDNSGNSLNSTNYSWNGTGWDTLLSFDYDYTYHSSGEWEQQTLNVWQSGLGFSPSSRITNNFNASTQEIDTVTFENSNGSVWTLSGKYESITWYDFPNRLYGSYLFQPYTGGVPQIPSRLTFYHTNALNYVQYLERQNGTAYDTISRTVREADASDNLTLIEQYNYSTSPPSQIYGEQFLHTYNGANVLTETIAQEYNTSSGLYEDIRVIQYFFGPVSRPEPATNQLRAVIFPNPATRVVNIELEAARPETLSLRIHDYTGQQVLASEFSSRTGNNRFEIPLEGLRPGVYLVSLSQGKLQSRKRLIIQ